MTSKALEIEIEKIRDIEPRTNAGLLNEYLAGFFGEFKYWLRLLITGEDGCIVYVDNRRVLIGTEKRIIYRYGRAVPFFGERLENGII